MKVSKSSNFIAHDEGTFRAVCVDVTPLEKRNTKFGPKEEFRVVFETDAEAREDGTPQCVWSRLFTPSLDERAAFRKFLRQWLGRDLTEAEEDAFETEELIGKPATVVVVHEPSSDGDKVYANIVACTPYKGKDALTPSGRFVRKKDREKPANGGGEEASYRAAADSDEVSAGGEAVDATKAGEDWTRVKVHVGKHSGVELRDLDPEAIEKLLTNWLPIHDGNTKPSANDCRLASALRLAQVALAEVSTGGDY